MKQRGIRKRILCLLAYILIANNVYVLSTEAGSSNIVVDNTSFREELDIALWNNPDKDIQVKNNTLIFPDDSTDTTSLISRTNAKRSEDHANLIDANINMSFTNLPKGEKFVLAFGLAGVEAMMGEAGNVEIYFTNKDGLQVSVAAYNLEGFSEVITKEVRCGSINNVKVDASISSKGILALKVNGKKVCNKKLPVSGEGSMGFLQTGSCGVKITDMKIVTYEYDRPENSDIFEDFEEGAINTNALTARLIYPSLKYAPTRAYVEKRNKNQVFRFENSGVSYIGTTKEYSNFEITFDVVYLQREHKLDEEGNVAVAKNSNFAVSFGDEAMDYQDYGYLSSADLILFEPASTVASLNTAKIVSAAEKGYPYYDPDCDKNFTVQVSMIDSVVTVKMKWLEENDYTEIMKYQISEKTPTGYVHIWTTGEVANFAIDNLSIVNKDKDSNIIELDYNSALITTPEDYKYEPMSHIYQEVEEKQSFNLYLIIPAVAVVCAVAVAITMVICNFKRKKVERKDGEADGEEQME